jgi:class 3 adenylate cyclase/tetratricopeptide (TPR) repeat protein
MTFSMAATDHPATRPLAPYVPVILRELIAGGRTGLTEVDGSILFADVSGFTALSERLAKHGREGTEALITLIDRIMDRLAGAAQQLGGDIIGFGGDALIVAFRDEGHELRAAAAAFDLQRALWPFRSAATGFGRATLSSSVGVASGPLLFAAPGTPHRGLIVAGPTSTLVCACEGEASAGQILLAPSTARALDPRVVGARQEHGHPLLERPSCDAPAPPSADDLAAAEHIAAMGLPGGLARHLAQSGESEHRQFVAGFVVVRGLDELLDRDRCAAGAAVAAIVDRVHATCAELGVTVVSLDCAADGFKAYLVAGAPRAGDADADALLSALRAIVEVDVPLAVAGGAASGRGFMVDVSMSGRRAWSVMGDTTNLAARVAHRAAPRRVLATLAALDATKVAWTLEEFAPFAAKGKSALVHTALVGPPGGGRRQAAPAAIIGREAERALLLDAQRSARAGAGRVVVVTGGPGLGKSWLVASVLGGDERLEIDGRAYSIATPYGVLNGCLRELLGIPADAAPADAADALADALAATTEGPLPTDTLVGAAIGLDPEETTATRHLDAAAKRRLVAAGIARLVRSRLEPGAVVLVEDAHWLDEASTGVIVELAREAHRSGWCMVVTRRDTGAGLDPAELASAQTLAIEPLSEADGAALVQARGTRLPSAVVERLVERARGNPLLLSELARAVRAGGDPEALPDRIDALMAARIHTLEPAQREAVRVASVLGASCRLEDVRDLLGTTPPAVPGVLELLGDGRLEFAHALLRDAAYESLAYRRRRALHAAAGLAIEQRSGEAAAAGLSLHFDMARDHARTWRYARLAAERADRAGAPAEATTHLVRALAAGRRMRMPVDELCAVAGALGDCAELAGRWTDAAAGYRTARRLARGRPLEVAELERREGILRERSASYDQALRWFARGLRSVAAAPAGDDADVVRAKLLVGRGASLLRKGRFRQAATVLAGAHETLERSTDRAALAHCLYLLDWALGDMGARDPTMLPRALEIYEELDDPAGQGTVLQNLGVDAYFAGNWTEALDYWERFRVQRDRTGDVAQSAAVANNVGEVLSDQGRLEPARALLEEALAIWTTVPFPIGIALATINLGRLATRDGRLDDAERLLDEARAIYERIGAADWVVETDSRRVERLLRAGDAQAAASLARDARARAVALGGNPVLLAALDRLLGMALDQLGDRPAAVELLRASLAAARGASADFEEAQTAHVLAALRPPDALALRERADALFTRLDVGNLAAVVPEYW